MNKTSFATLKGQAKASLTNNYWNCFGVCAVVTIIISTLVSIVTAISVILAAVIVYWYMGLGGDAAVTAMSSISSLASTVITIPIAIFVLVPVSIGIVKYFINAAHDTQNANDVLFPFKNRFGNVVLTNFLLSLYTFFWSLLFIVPGIIKSFEYSMIPYIMAENPAIDRKRAFEVSKALTDGNKWRIFVFGLSFIGWILLSMLTCGIGVFFLDPYMQAAYTQLYFDLKLEATAKGTVNQEDFTYNNVN